MRGFLCALAFVLALPAAMAAGLAPVPPASRPLDQDVSGAEMRRQIEEDWLRQSEGQVTGGAATTQGDARGGCDGVKNGLYAFHTGQEPNPWWQVDLGRPLAIARIVVYNRLDYAPGLHNADNLHILSSDDGKTWTERYDNKGKYFGGVTGAAKPLEVAFPDLRARYLRLQVASAAPIFFHLDEVEVYGPGANAPNLALHRPADQSSLSVWSTNKPLVLLDAERVFPTAQAIERGRRLAADLEQGGLDCRPYLQALDAVDARLKALPADAPAEARRRLYLDARWAVRRLAFANPLLRFDRLLFVKRHTQETYPDVCLNHMPWVSRPGGDLCVLSAGAPGGLFAALAEPGEGIRLRQILNRALGPGHVHGADLGWDGRRIVFGYARAESDAPPAGWLDRAQSYRLRRTVEPIHLYEIGVDGTGLRQITGGEWSDLDPTYAANGDIVFVSERCGTSLQCNEFDKDETSCNLYVVRPDGRGLRRLSVNKDGDYLPHALDDGTIAYTRWEYHERSWAFIQSIWTIRPDGTFADALFKQHFTDPWALEETRSIPGSKKLVAIAAGHHTLPVGPLVVVNPSEGINDPRGIAIVTPGIKPPEGGMSGVPVPGGGVPDAGGFYATPVALSEHTFLVSYTYGSRQTDPGYALYLVDVFGNKELVYRDAGIGCFLPLPLRARKRPPACPPVPYPRRKDAECVVSDAAFGCDDLGGRQARYLRIAEPIGWPYDNERGGQRYGEDHRFGGPGAERKNLLSWTPIRILGDVPLERDGSAHFRVPADRAVYFQLLDEKRRELRRMRSFISFQPGEVRACVGCHETKAISPSPARTPIAARRPAATPMPPPWGTRPVSFLRDIQPIFDRRCSACHTGLKPAGGMDFSPGLTSHDPAIAGYGFNRAYETLIGSGLVSLSEVRKQDSSITPPLAYGSLKSKLLQVLSQAPHTQRAPLTEEERLRLAIWIDANAPYHDLFVNKRPERPAYDLAGDQELLKRVGDVHQRRCASCHQPAEVTRLDWVDLRQPARSLFLSAPLAKAAGGSGKCPGAPYQDAGDADYRALRALVEAAVARAWESPRRDLVALKEEKAPPRVSRAGRR